jgi:hypothetical protein
MQCRSVLIHYCRSLGAAVSDRAVEIQRVDAMLAERAFECGAAAHRFGGVISHIFIVVLLPVCVPGNGCATLEQERLLREMGRLRNGRLRGKIKLDRACSGAVQGFGRINWQKKPARSDAQDAYKTHTVAESLDTCL